MLVMCHFLTKCIDRDVEISKRRVRTNVRHEFSQTAGESYFTGAIADHQFFIQSDP
jgi:hypothetical protein